MVTVQEVYSAQNSKVFEIVGRSELETQSIYGNIAIIANAVRAQLQFTSVGQVVVDRPTQLFYI